MMTIGGRTYQSMYATTWAVLCDNPYLRMDDADFIDFVYVFRLNTLELLERLVLLFKIGKVGVSKCRIQLVVLGVEFDDLHSDSTVMLEISTVRLRE